jgi:hypothetical protein
LAQLSPGVAPLLLALNNTATYIGLACSGVLGGAVLQSIGGQYLGLVAAGLIAIAFLLAEAAHYCSRHPRATTQTPWPRPHPQYSKQSPQPQSQSRSYPRQASF